MLVEFWVAAMDRSDARLPMPGFENLMTFLVRKPWNPTSERCVLGICAFAANRG